MTNAQESALNNALRCDEWYQILLESCTKAERDFLRIRDMLSEHDKECLDNYISLCEELEYRRACLALQIRT